MLPRSDSRRGGLAVVGALVFASVGTADDWPQWLGPHRDNVWKETGLPDSLPKDGPAVVWKVPVAAGYAGPAVANGKVYVTDRRTPKPNPDAPPPKGTLPGDERLLCVDAATGKTVWEHVYDCPYKKVQYPLGPRTTPAVVGDRVYTLGAMGDLLCLDAGKGAVVWKKSFPTDLEAPVPFWGWSSSVLVDGGTVYAQVGGPGRAVVAFDAATGAEKWKALTTKDVGYAPPVLATLGGTRQLVVWLSDQVAGLNPTTGEVYWSEKHPAAGKKQMEPAVTVTTPKVAGDRLYISSFYDGTLALQFASGKPVPTIAWRADDIYPKVPEKLPTLMSSLIVRDGHVYGIEGMGGKVVCLEEVTGKEVWRDDGLYSGKETVFGTAFWVEAGSSVFALTDEGDLVVLELSPKGYKEKGRAKVIEATHAARGRKVVWAHPAFAGGRMIVRNDREMICVQLAK